MARLSRYTQKIFGSTATTNQLSKFGSLAAGAPERYDNTTITPTLIQALGNYLTGWFGAVIGDNSPAIEDMNSMFYLTTYQLAYLMQQGLPEWDSGTTYYTGQLASNGAGRIYSSLQNTNLNHVLTDAVWWREISTSTNIVEIDPATQSPYEMTAADNGKTFLVNTANGPMTFVLPGADAFLNFTCEIKDKTGNCATNNIDVESPLFALIEGLGTTYIMQADWIATQFEYNGTDYFITGGK